MPEYSTTEIAAQCRVSERTIQRWIKEGLLPVHEVMRNRYIVDDADIEKMKPRTIQAHRDELTHRIEDLETQMEKLQKAIDRLTDVIQAITTPRHEEAPETRYSAKAPVPDEEAETLAHFADRHGIKPSTYKRWAKDEAQLKPGPGNKYSVSPEVAAAFYEHFRNHTGFHERDCCPHQS